MISSSGLLRVATSDDLDTDGRKGVPVYYEKIAILHEVYCCPFDFLLGV
jgi:hypothetical protein